MHIGFRTSGGRGEYEVVGSHSGYSAASLEGWSFFMNWPDGTVRDTGLWLDPGDSGKPRLRSVLSQPMQIGRILTALLALPDPTRSLKLTPIGWPIVVEKKYSVTQVGFGPESDFAELAERVTFTPSWVEVANQGSSDAIGVESRWQRLATIHGKADELPTRSLQVAVAAHRDIILAGGQPDARLGSSVAGILRSLDSFPDAMYAPGTDPLPTLEALLDIPEFVAPTLPPPDMLTEDEPEISARSACEYRLAKTRGAAGRAFGELVRAAYHFRCAMCGARFGDVEGVRSGIDAAHILAWSKHDLDVISNGIALCKTHHWAFDAGIVMPSVQDGVYSMRFTRLAEKLDNRSLSLLGEDGQIIPDDRLPTDVSQRPSANYLQRVYADLGVEFSDSP